MGFFDVILEEKPQTTSSTPPTTTETTPADSLIIMDTPTAHEVPNTAAELFSPTDILSQVVTETVVSTESPENMVILDTPTETPSLVINEVTPLSDMIVMDTSTTTTPSVEIVSEPVVSFTETVIATSPVLDTPDTDTTLRRAIEDLRKNDAKIEAQIQEALDAAAKCEAERTRLEAERVRLASEAEAFVAQADSTRASGKRTKDLIALIESQLTA